MPTLLDMLKMPDTPVRSRRDVEEILIRWDDHFSRGRWSGAQLEMEQDIQALAAIAIEALPD